VWKIAQEWRESVVLYRQGRNPEEYERASPQNG